MAITPVPNGPLVKKNGSTLKNGGKLKNTMAKKVIKKAENGATASPAKSKDLWNKSAGFFEPSRRNQILDSTFTPQGVNKAKLKEHASTIRKMDTDKEYLAREKALPAKMTGELPSWKNGGSTKKYKSGGVIKKSVAKPAVKKTIKKK